MSRNKKIHYAIITPKNEAAKRKLEYHGEKWEFRKLVAEVKFSREPGPYAILMSRDGKKCIIVKTKEDPDFDIRMQD